MRLLGVYSIGETPSADESADALFALNSMVDSWSNENLFIYAKTLNVINFNAGVVSHTVGPSGQTITERPIEVLEASHIQFEGVDYPLSIFTLTDYEKIPIKTTQGIPTILHVLPNMPNIRVQLWPVPSATMTLNLWSNKALQSFASLTDVVTLPPGYERALAYCLAQEIGPEFDVVVSPDITKKAMQARKVIKRTNTEVPRLSMPYGIPMGDGFVNYRNA
jgi:hypothetical protein